MTLFSKVLSARRFGFASALSVTDQALSAAVGFLVAIYIGRQIGISGLGVFAITSVLILAVHSLLNGVVWEAMAVLGPRRDKSERAEYLGFLLGAQILAALGITGLAALGLLLAVAGQIIGQHWLAPVLACLGYTNLLGLQLFFRRHFYVQQRPGAAFTQSLLFLPMALSGLLLLSLFGQPTVPYVYGVLSICSATICVWRLSKARLYLAAPSSNSILCYITEHWRYGRWVLLTVPFVIGSYQVYYLLIGYFIGNDQAGLLKGADTLILPFEQFCVGLSLLFVPLSAGRIDRLSVTEQRTWALRLLLGTLVFAGAYAVLLLTTGEFFLVLLFGGHLKFAFSILPIMAFLPVLRAVAVPASIALTASKRPDLKCLSYAVSTTATITVGAWLVQAYSLLGAALGLFFSMILFAIAQWLCLAWLWRK